MKPDIKTSAHIVLLVDTFYEKVRSHSILAPIFEDVAQINWEKHLPKMYAFWGSILLGEHSYSGNPMQKHVVLSKMTAMSENEFSEWLRLFNQTIDELFLGERAEEAKIRAQNIARLMLHNIQTA